nr:succinate dehydrogenase, cytochrome b556 subunit [Aliidiomarina iranensis]
MRQTVVKKQRPVNLELSTISFPPAAISSILHRVSGVIMLVLVGLLVWLLAKSLTSPEGFAEAQAVFAHPIVRFLVWGFLAALGYHLLAGIRHIFMDLGFGEEKESGRNSAVLVIAGGVVLAILAGVWLW